MYVGFFIQDAKLVISIDQLDASVVSVLTSFFVLEPEILHVFLEGQNDHVEFFDLIDILIDELFLLFFLEFILVEFGFGLVSFVDFELFDMIIVLDGFVFLRALILQDLELVLEDLDSFLKFSQILRGVLDEIDVFVSGGFDFFVKGLEVLEFILGFLLFFGKIENQQLFDFEFLLGLTDLSVSDRGFSGHGLSDSCGVLNFFVDITDNFFKLCQSIFHLSDLHLNLFLFTFVISGL